MLGEERRIGPDGVRHRCLLPQRLDGCLRLLALTVFGQEAFVRFRASFLGRQLPDGSDGSIGQRLGLGVAVKETFVCCDGMSLFDEAPDLFES